MAHTKLGDPLFATNKPIQVLEFDCKDTTDLKRIIIRNHGTTSTPYVSLVGSSIILILDGNQRPPYPTVAQANAHWTNADGS